MSYLAHSVPQRSPEWYALRAGRIGSSDAGVISDLLKSGKESAGRRDLRTQKALERITGSVLESSFVNADIQRGIDLEPDAILGYSMTTGQIVHPCGYLTNGADLGYSPDGLIDGGGMLEIKCPRPANHLTTWRECAGSGLAGVPSDYHNQVLHAFTVVDDAQWLDFVSYSPVFPPSLVLYVHRVTREDVTARLATYQTALAAFLSELHTEIGAINALAEVHRNG
jgi:hypothetical protein